MSKLFKNMSAYSKERLDLMIRLWIVGAFFGAAVVIVEIILNVTCASDMYFSSIPIHLPELLVYVGAPITGGIVTYLIKSALENVADKKHRRNDYIPNEYPDEP